MKQLVFFMCLLVSTLAAPAPASESNEIAAQANEALRWMEMYRLYQQQGIVRNPFLPSADASAVPAGPAVMDAALARPAPIPIGDASEEETEDGKPATKAAAPIPLNSDEAEEAEEAEEVEAADADPAVLEAAPAEPSANPAAAVEPAVVDVPIDAVPVDAVAAVDVPPVDVVPVDSAPAAPEVAVDPAAPATADILAVADVPAEVDAGATDVGAAPLAAETNMTGGAADPTAL